MRKIVDIIPEEIKQRLNVSQMTPKEQERYYVTVIVGNSLNALRGTCVRRALEETLLRNKNDVILFDLLALNLERAQELINVLLEEAERRE